VLMLGVAWPNEIISNQTASAFVLHKRADPTFFLEFSCFNFNFNLPITRHIYVEKTVVAVPCQLACMDLPTKRLQHVYDAST
jgi:hypothetical protein